MRYKVTFYRTIFVSADSQLQAEKVARYDLGLDLVEPQVPLEVRISRVKQ